MARAEEIHVAISFPAQGWVRELRRNRDPAHIVGRGSNRPDPLLALPMEQDQFSGRQVGCVDRCQISMMRADVRSWGINARVTRPLGPIEDSVGWRRISPLSVGWLGFTDADGGGRCVVVGRRIVSASRSPRYTGDEQR